MNLNDFCDVVERQLRDLADAIRHLRPGVIVNCGTLSLVCGKQPYLSCLIHPEADNVDLCVRCEIAGGRLYVEADVTKSDGEIISEMDRFEVVGEPSEAYTKVWSYVCGQDHPIVSNLSE